MREIIIDNVDFRKLLVWMNIPQTISNSKYEEWKSKRLSRKPHPREYVYFRGADFSGYWRCPRRLFWTVHDPLQQKSMINKSIYKCVVRHDRIEDYLAKYDWKGEHAIKGFVRVGKFRVPCYGHIDGLSPSNFILDIKHGKPKTGDRLQTGFYQKVMRPLTTNIILLYPSELQIIPNMDKVIKEYLPRVYACVGLDILPPLHPDFPNCFYNCEYYKRCGRTRVPPRKQKQEIWGSWFKAIKERII